jgi:hypothetical protein
MNATQSTVLQIGIGFLLTLVSLGAATMATDLHLKVPRWLHRVLFASAIGVASIEGFYFWHLSIVAQIIAIVADIGLLIYLFWPLRKGAVTIRGGTKKMLLVLGMVLVVAGIVGGSVLIETQTVIKTTIVYCCIRDNEYQVWAVNQGDDKDVVFVTLQTSSGITEIEPLMGANMPTVIEGGPKHWKEH